MEDYKKVLGVLVFVASFSAVYIIFEDAGVKMRIDNDVSKFYTKDGRWLISGEERNKLYSGSKLVYRDARNVDRTEEFIGTKGIIRRKTPFKNGAMILDTYTFDGALEAVETFPVSHTIEIFNASGLIYMYEVKRLVYTGDSVWDVTSPQSFGRNMKVEFDDGYYYSSIYKYKNKNEGRLWVKYRIIEDYVKLDMRLFDPPAISFVDPTPTDNNETSNTYAYVNVSVSDATNTTSFIDWDNSLVGWWRFDNSTDFLDHSTQENNGTNNDTTYTTDGMFGGCREFSGVSSTGYSVPVCDYVDCGNDSSLNFNTGDFSIELWFNTKDLNYNCNTTALLSKYTTVNWEGYSIWLTRDEEIQFDIQNETDNIIIKTSTNFYSVDTWYHVVGLRDGTDMKLYVDGTLEATTTHNFNNLNLDAVINTNVPFIIGNWNPHSGESDPINGTIDEVRAWSRALSPDEINASYNTGTHNLGHNFTSLTDGTYEYTAYSQDTSGNLNNTETRTITIDTLPLITITSPTNTTYYKTSIDLNWSVNQAFDWAGYSLNSGNNITLSTNITITGIEGSNNVTIWANDSTGDMNSTTVYFTTDTINPIYITDCLELDIAYGEYYLTQDITDSSTSECIDITASHITFDCQGYTISSDGVASYGINADKGSISNLTIQNCILDKWVGGSFYIELVDGVSITNNTCLNTQTGLEFYHSNDINATNCTITNITESGIHIQDSNNTIITMTNITNTTLRSVLMGNVRNVSIYNNLFNDTTYLSTLNTIENTYFNTTEQTGTRIHSTGNYIGGNYYTNSSGTGYSDTCADIDEDDFCDIAYTITTGIIDYLPYTNTEIYDFTISESTGTAFYFYASQPVQTEIEPYGQTSTKGMFTIENNLTSIIDIYAILNETKSGITLKLNDEYDYDGAVSISTTGAKIYDDLAVSGTGYIWAWADFNNLQSQFDPKLTLKAVTQ